MSAQEELDYLERSELHSKSRKDWSIRPWEKKPTAERVRQYLRAPILLLAMIFVIKLCENQLGIGP